MIFAKKVRRPAAVIMCLMLTLFFSVGSVNSFACSKNYASTKESGYVLYTGTICFNPSHKTAKCGYGIKNGKYVKKAFHKYSRNGKVYSSGVAGPAKKKVNKKYVSVIRCLDDVRWGDKYITRYNYSWWYF